MLFLHRSTALAEELGRNRGSVTRDSNKLKSYGLLRLREEVNPGAWCGADRRADGGEMRDTDYVLIR
jgi:hypothetical protein